MKLPRPQRRWTVNVYDLNDCVDLLRVQRFWTYWGARWYALRVNVSGNVAAAVAKRVDA